MTTPRDDTGQPLDLTLLAIQQRFLEEWRAGNHPRLSVYAARYPDYAEALADLVMRLEPEEQAAQAIPEPLAERFLSSEGARRALETIAAAMPADGQLPRVAERPASYDTRGAAPAPSQPPTDPNGD